MRMGLESQAYETAIPSVWDSSSLRLGLIGYCGLCQLNGIRDKTIAEVNHIVRYRAVNDYNFNKMAQDKNIVIVTKTSHLRLHPFVIVNERRGSMDSDLALVAGENFSHMLLVGHPSEQAHHGHYHQSKHHGQHACIDG